MTVYLNGMDISASSLSMVGDTATSGSTGNTPSPGITITRTANVAYRVTFDYGIALSIGINSGGLINVLIGLPAVLQGLTQGLLGNFDGDPSNDFVLRNGSVISNASTDFDIHFEFGLSCESGIYSLNQPFPSRCSHTVVHTWTRSK